MRIGSRQFSIPVWALCLYLIVVLCMLWLANWQLDRAALKTQMQQAATQARESVAVPVEALENLADAATNYQRVLVEGVYLDSLQFLWDNRTHKGQAGFEVISPLRQESGNLVLINRGWVPMGPSRAELPDVALPQNVVDQKVVVEGFLTTPSKGFASGPSMQEADQWPRMLQYFDYAQLGQALKEPVVPVVVQAQALDNGATTPIVLTSRPEWLTANWQPAASGPAKHYSYAFQWFAMAIALTIITFVVNSRKQETVDE